MPFIAGPDFEAKVKNDTDLLTSPPNQPNNSLTPKSQHPKKSPKPTTNTKHHLSFCTLKRMTYG